MENDFRELEKLFDSIIDEIEHPEKAGTYKNPFASAENQNNGIGISGAVSVIFIKLLQNNMRAVAVVVSNTEKHKPYTADDIRKAAAENGVVFGLDDDAIEKMAEAQVFNRETVIARGTFPKSGANGYIENFCDCEEGGQITDFIMGRAICRVVPPKAGEDGRDVCGGIIPAETGLPVSEPVGDGVYIENGTVFSGRSGTLSLNNGRYSIINELIINKDVKALDGVIAFGGNIVINGNVKVSATIKADGDVTVHGNVSNSSITAGGRITVDGDITDDAKLKSGGDISAKVIERSTVKSGGMITAGFISYSKAKCITGVKCLTGKGSIIGGTVESAGTVECLYAGCREHDVTVIIIGNHSEFVEEKAMLEFRIKKIDDELHKINAEVTALAEKKSIGSLSLEDEGFLNAAERITVQKTAEKKPLYEKISQIEKIIESINTAQLIVHNRMFANVELQIGECHHIMASDKADVTAYVSSNNIVIT